MKSALFVSLGIWPSAEARKATEVRAWQNLAALKALGYDITVIATPDAGGRTLTGCRVILAEPAPQLGLLDFFRYGRQYRRTVTHLVARALTDASTVLLCEHWMALACSAPSARVVYSCHDFEAQLLRLRRSRRKPPPTWRTKLHWRVAAALEHSLHRKVARFISVSATEAVVLGARYGVPVEYIPNVASTGSSRPVPLEDGATPVPPGPPRLWFYGNAAATSNKIMLDHLRSELFELLEAAVPWAEFHQAGNFAAYDRDVIDWLHQKFRVHGFLENPAQAFRAGDLCLMPYEQDTGFRTKIPELCGYGVIPVGYPISFACCPEMRNGENCVMASTSRELAEQVAEVCADVDRRNRLAEGAIDTRLTHFSAAVLLQKYRRVLDFDGPLNEHPRSSR